MVSDHYELKKIDLEHRHARRLPELEFQREKESEKKQKKNDRAREGPRSLLQLEFDDGGGWNHQGS